MNGLVNWAAIRRNLFVHEGGAPAPMIDWNTITEMYDGMAKLEKAFTQKQVDALLITKDDTVVDIGCGPGRLTVPMAHKAKSVTCVDAYEKMLERCMHNAKHEGLDNVTPLFQSWLDEDAVEKIGKHDIAVASRSVGMFDLIKLNQLATKYVFVMSFANAPSLREIQLDFLEGISDIPSPKPRPDARMFDYNVTFNMIYDMGANPSVVVLDDGFERTYASKEEAYEDLRFVGTILPEHEARYRANVDRYLNVLEDGRVHLLRKTQTYVMWWKPCEIKL